MAHETQVRLTLDSGSLFQAVQAEFRDWMLEEHRFDPSADEVLMSYDSAGSGRVALTIAFELTAEQMARVLSAARPAG